LNELFIRFNQKTHKPKFIGIAKPAKNCKKCELSKNEACNTLKNTCKYGSSIKKLYGEWNAIITPHPRGRRSRKMEARGS